jgi:protein phosphatase PTC7
MRRLIRTDFIYSSRHGDIIMLLTDGVLDNVWPRELAAIVALVMQEQGSVSDEELVQKLANVCVEYSRRCSLIVDRRSPFEAEAERHGLSMPGGKVDDSTVLVALALER